MENGTRFFSNRACAHFPCHAGVDPDEFNCLFCYCPLYALGPTCGGDFHYNEKGYKVCTDCTRLHEGDVGLEFVMERFGELAELAREDLVENQVTSDGGDGPGGTADGDGGAS